MATSFLGNEAENISPFSSEEETEEEKEKKQAESNVRFLSDVGISQLARKSAQTEEIRQSFLDTPQKPSSGYVGSFLKADDTGISETPAGFEYIDLPHNIEDKKMTVDNVVDFLVGDEMAVLGMKFDEEGFGWDWEVAKHQWSEEPMWVNLLASASLVGTIAFPALKAGQASLKFGRAGKLLGKIPAREEEIAMYRRLGAFAEIPDEQITESMLGKARRLEHSRSKYLDFARKKEAERTGELNLGPIENLKYKFDKKFANTYMEKTRSIAETGQIDKEYAASLDRVFGTENLGAFFIGLPDADRGIAMYSHALKRMKPDLDLEGIAKKVNPDFDPKTLKLSDEEKLWADNLYDAMRAHQEEALGDAFITKEMFDKVGEVHIPAFRLGTPAPEFRATQTFARAGKKAPGSEPPRAVLKRIEMPRLYGPQILTRKAELPEVAERLFRGELISDPADLTMRGLVMDRMLLNNFRFIRDLTHSYGRRSSDILAKYGTPEAAEKAGWISMSSRGKKALPEEVTSTVRRMLRKSGYDVADGEALPYLHESLFEELFGSSGVFAQTQMAASLFEALVTVHKTSKTAFCLTGNTRILTDKGYIKIKDAYEYKPGFNYDISINAPKIWSPVENEWISILASYHEESSECLKVTLKDGTVLEGTLNHPVFSGGQKKTLSELKIGDKLNACLKDYPESFKSIPEIIKIENTGKHPVYDISLPAPHLFVAEGLVNHNSIPTHFQNIFGNFAMLMQAGWNPLSPTNINTMSKVSRSLNKVADVYRASRQSEKTVRELLQGVNLGKVKIGKVTLDMTEEFADPMVRDLIEENAFQQAEGLGHLTDMLERVEKGTLTEGVIKGMLGLRNIGGKATQKVFDTSTTTYLLEDQVPKFAYYLDLRSQGWSREWAALEVGRRLPMYGTVGSAIRRGRRVVFPWATFPSEALRITKNNLTDHPIRMMPWLHMPAILQAGLSMAGAGPATKDETRARQRQLPLWAQNPMSVVTQGQRGAQFGAGFSGAATGATVGGVAAGAPGAAAGAVLGALAGVSAVRAFEDEKRTSEGLRGAVLNWLPHSAFLPTSNSPDYIWDVQGAMAQLPVEPLSIFRTMIEIASGRTAFGQEVGGEDLGDKFGKVVAGAIGFMAPPWFQRYGFRTTTPDAPITRELFGKKVPGDITNVSRLLVESGQAVDPITHKPGSLTFDLLVNNVGGLWRSYAINPEAQLINEGRAEKHLAEIRSHLTRNLSYYVENGNDAIAGEILSKVFATFSRQYANDPAIAQEKFQEWMMRNIRNFGRHPQLRNWSEDEIRQRFIRASEFAKGTRSNARRDLLRVLQQEVAVRKLGRGQ